MTEAATPARLIDWVPEGARLSDPGAVLDRFMSWAARAGFSPLYPHQEAALLELAAGKHVVLSTPTGSGKSLVALGLHFAAMCEGRRSFYTAPIKALVSEKFFALCELFGAENVGMLTGDASINWAAPILCVTQEVLANMALRQGERCDAPYVVMDEFHFYGDRDRGHAWQTPLLILRGTRFLLMSATLGNTAPIEERLADFTGRPVAHVHSDERPVPLDYDYRETPIHETVEDLLDDGRAPVYVVSFTQREATEIAGALTSARIATRAQREALREVVSGFHFDTPFGKEMRRIVSHGVGVHHAGLLPKYRLLVEQLAQQGLLRVISGTDTLGVGVNIPIRTVLFSGLAKFDGEKVRILSVRDFKQISGRAGRKGFDERGSVVCQAPEHVIANLRARRARGGHEDARRSRETRRGPHGYVERSRTNVGKREGPGRRPPPGVPVWSRETFEQLVKRPPETLESRFQVSHSIMVPLLQREPGLAGPRGGYGNLGELVARSHTKPEKKRRLVREAARLFRALRRAGLVHVANHRVLLDPELQRDFSLHQTLSLFLVEAISALDANDPAYALQVVTCVESVLEDPVVILRAQVRQIRAELAAKLKAERVPYEERVAKLDAVTHPKPDARFLWAAFRIFADHHPWVSDETVRPKSIAREMMEGFESFGGYVRRYGIQRNEGTLLRYLAQVLQALDQSVPDARKTDEIHDLLAYLRDLVRRTDTSLLEEWESRVAGPGEAPAPVAAPRLREVAASPRAFQARVRTELHALVRALAERDWEEAALYVHQDPADPWDAERFEEALRPYFERHPHLRVDPAARRAHHTVLKEIAPRVWSVQHALLDPEAEDTWCIEGRIDLREPFEPEAPLVRVLAIHD